MRKFIAGIIFALIIVAVLIAGALYSGIIDFRADVPVNRWEQRIAEHAAEASVERRAPAVQNPVSIKDQVLIEGADHYNHHCAVCHGGSANPISDFHNAFYPRVPQFLSDPPNDIPEHMLFYITKHGIRWTGMPAWGGTMSDEEIWKVVAFLSRMENLPPAVEAEWKKLPPPAMGHAHGNTAVQPTAEQKPHSHAPGTNEHKH